jgi:hypothetical protein
MSIRGSYRQLELPIMAVYRKFREDGVPRSFGAKNNDPLEVIIFTGLFERLSWLG